MTARALESVAAAPPPEVDYLARVRDLAPLIAGSADETERGGRLPQKLADAMMEAGLFRMLVPRPFGGAELDPPSFVQVIEAVAKLDASTAWALCQTSVCGMTAAFLPSETARQIWGRDPRGVLAWGPGPGRAVAVEGGYRVTGSWAFASGGWHATWLAANGCPIHEADGTPRRRADGKPVERTLLFPAAAVKRVEMWNVMGLRGTGSDGYTVTDLFVPETHSVARGDPAERTYFGTLYGVSHYSMYACGFACLALGVARSMLDALVQLAGEKTPRGYKHTLRNDAVVQTEVAYAEAQLRSARRNLLGALGEAWAHCQETGAVTLEQRMDMRLAATYAIHEARTVAEAAYAAAGASAIFTTGPFERRFRDIHTVAQQLQGRKSHLTTVGKHLLGLEPEPEWL